MRYLTDAGGTFTQSNKLFDVVHDLLRLWIVPHLRNVFHHCRHTCLFVTISMYVIISLVCHGSTGSAANEKQGLLFRESRSIGATPAHRDVYEFFSPLRQ